MWPGVVGVKWPDKRCGVKDNFCIKVRETGGIRDGSKTGGITASPPSNLWYTECEHKEARDKRMGLY